MIHHASIEAVAAVLVISSLLTGCKPVSEKPRHDTIAAKATAPSPSKKNDGAYEAMLDRLNADIGRLTAAEDPSVKIEFVNHSRDSAGGGFFCLGKGVANPKLPEAAQEDAQRRAAVIIAERWALYLKKWAAGEYVPLNMNIRGQITYSRTVYEKRAGDTLVTLLAIPLGSIVPE